MCDQIIFAHNILKLQIVEKQYTGLSTDAEILSELTNTFYVTMEYQL